MPTLTPHDDMDPSPRVDILFSSGELTGGTETVTVHQISAAGDIEVRNAVAQPATGGFFVTDYEVPAGISVTYRAEQFNSSGTSLGYTTSADTQVDFGTGYVVMQDPLAPENAVLVRAGHGFAERLTYVREAKRYRAGPRTVTLMGEQSLLEDLNLHVITETTAQQEMLDAVLAEGTVLVRSMPPLPLPRALHVVIPAPSRRPHAQHGGEWSEYSLTGSQVSRNTIDIVNPVVTYEWYNNGFATYTAFNAAYATYLAAIADPPPEP